MQESKVQKSQNHWVNFFKPRMAPLPIFISYPTTTQTNEEKTNPRHASLKTKIVPQYLLQQILCKQLNF
jgi:hypothetical protein